MKKRNLLKSTATKYSSEVIGLTWSDENSGAYGDVNIPLADKAISLRGDSTVVPSISDEASGAIGNGRERMQSNRMRGQTKINLSVDLDASGSVSKEWSIGSFLKSILGKKTTNASSVNASGSVVDPTSSKAGIVLTAAGSLAALAGNYASVKLVNGGATGSVSLNSSSSPEFVLTYYNNSTVAAVVSALDSHADLACVADANGNASTDLFKDLLANTGIISGQKVYLKGGSPAGFQYDNSEAPSKDHTLVYNKEKTGYVVNGVIYDKLSLDLADKQPTAKIEGEGRWAKTVGIARVSADVSASNKVYISDEKQFGDYDPDAPQYIDIVSIDGQTKKYSKKKITGKDYDTGWFVTLDSSVTCTANDFIAFHEPDYWNPDINPINGLGGHVKIDNELFTDIKSVKFDYNNNLQIFNNFALQKSISGFAASKYIEAKIQINMLVRSDKMGIIQKLQGSETAVIPVEVKIGNSTGEIITIFMRFVEFKSPNLGDKGEEVQEVTLEGMVVSVPGSSNVPSVVIITH